MRTRDLTVPPTAHGMRLDRFLARWFRTWSRAALVRGVRAGQVLDADGRPLRPSARVREGQLVRVAIPGLAPTTAPPPLPTILYEDDRIIALDKPAGLLAHPAGTEFAWSAVSLAKERWPDQAIDLVHRLDRDTSGVLLLSRDADAGRHLKAAIKAGAVDKVYEALCRGEIAWDTRSLTGPIGPAGGEIRIQMAVREGGLAARTDVEVLARQPGMTRVRCRLYTGRTHQIRVHLDHAGHSLVGDRMYGVPSEVFLRAWEQGVDEAVIRAAGAPRQALHARRVTLPHPDGHDLTVEAPVPADLERWWADPSVLPLDPG